eukprot:12939077-Prorocentrum_lima.AAC.1
MVATPKRVDAMLKGAARQLCNPLRSPSLAREPAACQQPQGAFAEEASWPLHANTACSPTTLAGNTPPGLPKSLRPVG